MSDDFPELVTACGTCMGSGKVLMPDDPTGMREATCPDCMGLERVPTPEGAEVAKVIDLVLDLRELRKGNPC